MAILNVMAPLSHMLWRLLNQDITSLTKTFTIIHPLSLAIWWLLLFFTGCLLFVVVFLAKSMVCISKEGPQLLYTQAIFKRAHNLIFP